MQHERKIPTLIGILLVFGAVFIFSLAFDTLKTTPLFSRASPSVAPKHVMFSNITDTSFAVSWLTDTKATGAIIVDGDGIGTSYDERDETDATSSKIPTLGSYMIHSVIVRNAHAKTAYHIRILSQGSVFQDGLKPFTVTTASTINGSGTTIEPAYGTAYLANGQPAAGALVYLTPEGGQTFSTFVTTSGSWVIPLHLARAATLDAFLPKTDRLSESIVIRAESGESKATTDSLNDNPVPSMTIGKEYNFEKIQAETSPPQLAQAPPIVLGAATSVTNPIVAIIQPAQGAALTSNKPLFTGTGIPGKQVLIIVGITSPTSDTVTVGDDGLWRYTPVRTLTEGKQSITISSLDVKNKPVALTHTFQVLKSGMQVLGDATPSATLEPTIADTPTPTATLAGEPLPTTGNELPTIMFILLGTMLVIGGSAMLAL